jgi:glyoxalase family protein
MDRSIPGIHHVTAIAGDPQRNLDFYAGTLGLRLVKLTVNFDDPGTYHLYYGDGQGRPGTILTFFPWPDAPRGRPGAGQVAATAFSIPLDAAEYWADRLRSHEVLFEDHSRFAARVLSLADPDGLRLELVSGEDPREGWAGSRIPAEYAIRGLYGVTLAEAGPDRTTPLLTATLAFRRTGEEGNRLRFETGEGGPGAVVEVETLEKHAPGRVAVGTVHHVAWRTPDDAGQVAWHDEIDRSGMHVTPVIDRKYFHSIYFREPGGILFEIATDPPGFAIDEPREELGNHLLLPPWLESHRGELERVLPALRLPALTRGA